MYNRQENVIKNCVLSKHTSNLREEAPDKLTNHTQYSREHWELQCLKSMKEALQSHKHATQLWPVTTLTWAT